jgi:hypothetical protein
MLSGNSKALPWQPDMETTFVAAVPLAHPLPWAFLALATGASDTHVGAVIQQKVGQHWQPLGFFSKKLSKTEVNYSTFDRELFANESGIKHFRSRLEGRPSQLWMDHKSLIYTLNSLTADLWPPAETPGIHIKLYKQASVCTRYVKCHGRHAIPPIGCRRRDRPGLRSHCRQIAPGSKGYGPLPDPLPSSTSSPPQPRPAHHHSEGRRP